ncbi:MAG: DinB family protein [Caldilineaceae bacterium]|nr:DinB family protein [Caldilineaceae bacterium]
MIRQIQRELKLNLNVVQAQSADLTHADSLLQLPFRGNCLNWVLGHIIAYRSVMCTLLEVEPTWDAAAYTRYNRDSEPISRANDGVPLTQMLTDLATAQDLLLSRLAELSDADLEKIPQGDKRNVGEQLAFLSWHETYHVGQTEYLRQLAGKDDKII